MFYSQRMLEYSHFSGHSYFLIKGYPFDILMSLFNPKKEFIFNFMKKKHGKGILELTFFVT